MWLFSFNALYSGAYFVYALATNIYTHTHGLIRSYSLNEYEADARFFLLKKWARRNQHAIFWLQQVRAADGSTHPPHPKRRRDAPPHQSHPSRLQQQPPQLALLPGLWHMALAWALYKYLACGRSPAVLERQVRGRIWWAVVLFVAALTLIQSSIFYARGGKFGPAHVRTHACVCVSCLSGGRRGQQPVWGLAVRRLFILPFITTRQMVVHLTSVTICFAVITILYGRTLATYVRRYGLKRTGRQWRPEEGQPGHWRQQRGQRKQGKPRRQHAALWRLVLLLTFFIATWLLVIANDYRSTRINDFLEPPMGDAPSTFMASRTGLSGWEMHAYR